MRARNRCRGPSPRIMYARLSLLMIQRITPRNPSARARGMRLLNEYVLRWPSVTLRRLLRIADLEDEPDVRNSGLLLREFSGGPVGDEIAVGVDVQAMPRDLQPEPHEEPACLEGVIGVPELSGQHSDRGYDAELLPVKRPQTRSRQTHLQQLRQSRCEPEREARGIHAAVV